MLCAPSIPAQQQALDSSARYFDVIGLVHLVGSGKVADPIRPEYVPAVPDGTRKGILGWSVQLTDDGKMGIIHLVAADHHAFDSILADKRPEIRVFEPGRTDKLLIETELKLFRKDFDLSKFEVRVR